MQRFVIHGIMLSVLACACAQAQTSVYPFANVHGYPHFNLSGAGMALGVSPSLAGVAAANPAAMADWPSNLAGIAYHAESSVDPAGEGMHHIRRRRLLPAMIGVVEPWMEAGVGLGYIQRYNRLTSESTGDGYARSYEDVLVDGIATCMAQRYDLGRFGEWDLGVRVEYLRMYYSLGFKDLAGGTSNMGQITEPGYGWAVGMRWQREIRSLQLEVGSQYERFSSMDAHMEMSYGSREVHATLPSALHTGVVLGNLPWVDLVCGWSHINHSKISDELRDRDEFSGSLVWRGPDALRVNVGAWSSGIDQQDVDDQEWNTVYLQTGVSWQVDNALMEIVLADSHFLGGEYRKQTLLRLAISYTMN